MESLIRNILNSGYVGVVSVTGGASGGIYELLRYGGASSTILEANIPYSTEAFIKLVGHKPDQFCSEEAARLLALTSCQRAIELSGKTQKIFGVGISCSLAKHENERPGRVHKIFAAFQTHEAMGTYHFFPKPDTRISQEDLSSRILLAVVAEAVNVCSVRMASPKMQITEEICKKVNLTFDTDYIKLLAGQTDCLVYSSSNSQLRLIIPGSFNPLHDGHRKMAQVAERLTGFKPTFELSIVNVDKKPLDLLDFRRRKLDFETNSLALVATKAPTFLEKARLFPGATFAVGIDTWLRLTNPKYCIGYNIADMFSELRDLNTKFLVFGRKVGEGFVTLNSNHSDGFGSDLAIAVSEEEFRIDLSSTEIRNRQDNG